MYGSLTAGEISKIGPVNFVCELQWDLSIQRVAQVLIWIIEVQRWHQTSRACLFYDCGMRPYRVECFTIRDTVLLDMSEYLFELCLPNCEGIVLEARCAIGRELKLRSRPTVSTVNGPSIPSETNPNNLGVELDTGFQVIDLEYYVIPQFNKSPARSFEGSRVITRRFYNKR